MSCCSKRGRPKSTAKKIQLSITLSQESYQLVKHELEKPNTTFGSSSEIIDKAVYNYLVKNEINDESANKKLDDLLVIVSDIKKTVNANTKNCFNKR